MIHWHTKHALGGIIWSCIVAAIVGLVLILAWHFVGWML